MKKIPIFIVGIKPRSGTNYLYNILALHPECVFSNHHGEDFILNGLDIYLEFYEKVTYEWKKDWNNNRSDFKKALEYGILKYLDPVESKAKYMISKTPEATNLDLFLKVFSQGYLIIITRNGQDLTESYTKSLNARFDDIIRGWSHGAMYIDKIVRDEDMMNSGRVAVIKYEDLYLKNSQVMSKLLDLLHLDKSKFDFVRSQNFDVIGSSSNKGKSNDFWEPIPKSNDFNPLNRSQSWSKWKHYRFNWLAGKHSKLLGYELYFETSNPIYYIYNIVLSLYESIYRVFRRIKIIIFASRKNKKALKRALKFKIWSKL